MPRKRRSLRDAKAQATLDLPLFAERGPENAELPLDEPKQAASPDVVNQQAPKAGKSDKVLRGTDWTLVRLVEEYDDAARARLFRQVIAGLRRIPGMQRETGWRSATTWDEVCVQMQAGESFYWELAYIPTIKQLIKAGIENLSEHERRAIWLQTDRGSKWLDDLDCFQPGAIDGYDSTEIPYNNADVVALLLDNVLTEATNYTNSRIRSYIDQLHGGD